MTTQSDTSLSGSANENSFHGFGCWVVFFILIASCCTVVTALFPLFRDDFLPAEGKETEEANKLITVTNAALVLVAALAGLSFAYAQAIANRPTVHRIAVKGGEFNTLGSIALLIACILRYAVILKVVSWQQAPVVFPPLAFVLFFIGVIMSHLGVGCLIHGIFTSWFEKPKQS